MKKIRVVGNGFVSQHLSYPIIPYLLYNIPLRVEANSHFIDKMLDEYKPDVLINCIGKTGTPNVDWCESHKEITAATNTALPILLAEACAKKSIHLIHIGSGCIFFGKSPNTIWVSPVAGKEPNINLLSTSNEIDMGWKETDFANPKSFYSKTKYAADLVLGDMKNVTVLRIRMPISDKNHPRNLLNKISKYDQLIDIPNSVTFMNDLVRCIAWVAEFGKTGIYHVTNPQPLSAAQIMREYQKYESDHKFKIISEEELDKLTIAKRSNCILDTRKLYSAGFTMTPSSDALTVCMKQYIKNIWSSNV